MATTYESIAAICYNLSLAVWIYIFIVYFFIYRLYIRPWIVRGEVWKRITNNTQGGVSVHMLQSYMKIYSASAGRTWILAAEMFDDIADAKENLFMKELQNLFPTIAALPTPAQRHAAMRLMPQDKYYPFYVTALMNPKHIEKDSTVRSKVYSMT